MIKKEYFRHLLNKKTIIVLLILVTLGIASFYIDFKDRSLYIQQFNSKPSDVNLVAMEKLIDDYNGVKFNINFFTTSDFIQIYIIILLLFIGIFLSSEMQKMVESGQENYILCRTNYKKHSKDLFIAQSLYIETIIGISFLLITILGFIIGGTGSGVTTIGIYEFNFISSILLIIFQFIVISLLLILVNGISLFLNIYIKNKLVIQCIPIVLFLIVPLLVASSIGNIFLPVGKVIGLFVPFSMVLHSYFMLQEELTIMGLFDLLIPIVVYCGLFSFIFRINRKTYSKDCL